MLCWNMFCYQLSAEDYFNTLYVMTCNGKNTLALLWYPKVLGSSMGKLNSEGYIKWADSLQSA